jgi:hypothetical protein
MGLRVARRAASVTDLYLHIGHAKTGSSYIQSTLARSTLTLEQQGLYYPLYHNIAAAAAGRIVSDGNGKILLEFMQQDKCEFCKDILLSSEYIFGYFRQDKFCDEFEAFVKRSFAAVKILLFIRDPVSAACSLYQQRVKNHGYTGTVSEFSRTVNRPADVDRVLDNIKRLPCVDVTVKNYSANNHVIRTVEEWLGLDEGCLTLPPVASVNRSLTRAELELQLLLNLELGSAYPAAHGAFTRQLPGLRSELVRPSIADQEDLWRRLSSHIERVNAQVEVGERYDMERDLSEPTIHDQTSFEFSREQLKVVASLIAREVKRAHGLRTSRSWRLAKPLRSVWALLSKVRRRR